RFFAADHHDVADHVLERLGRGGIGRRLAAEHRTQEPPGPVDPDVADGLLALPLDRDLARQFDAERALALFHAAARVLHAGGEFGPHLVPDAGALGRGEGVHLQGAVADQDERPDDLIARDVELHFEALAYGQAQTAEVDALPFGVRLVGVP